MRAIGYQKSIQQSILMLTTVDVNPLSQIFNLTHRVNF
jgi:hypothetical protein